MSNSLTFLLFTLLILLLLGHAYHTLVSTGMNPSNIIMMFADDVANSPENPFPGQLFNKPTTAGTPGI